MNVTFSLAISLSFPPSHLHFILNPAIDLSVR